MATPWDVIAAVKCRADKSRDCVGEFAPDVEDDEEAVKVDAWAELMIARGMERRAAMLAASDIWESQQGTEKKNDGMARLPAESLRAMAIKIVQSPKPRLSAGCLLLGMGMDYKAIVGGSVRAWAKQQGVTPEHAANEVEAWQAMLGLPRTSSQKSERARRVYRETNGAQMRKAA